MSNVNMDGLPPEMQARIAQIIEGAKQKVAPAEPAAQAPGPLAPAPVKAAYADGSRGPSAARSCSTAATATSNCSSC